MLFQRLFKADELADEGVVSGVSVASLFVQKLVEALLRSSYAVQVAALQIHAGTGQPWPTNGDEAGRRSDAACCAVSDPLGDQDAAGQVGQGIHGW